MKSNQSQELVQVARPDSIEELHMDQSAVYSSLEQLEWRVHSAQTIRHMTKDTHAPFSWRAVSFLICVGLDHTAVNLKPPKILFFFFFTNMSTKCYYFFKISYWTMWVKYLGFHVFLFGVPSIIGVAHCMSMHNPKTSNSHTAAIMTNSNTQQLLMPRPQGLAPDDISTMLTDHKLPLATTMTVA